MEFKQLDALLKSQAASKGIERIVSVDQKAALASGENFLSDIFRLRVVVQLTNGKQVRKWFILKKSFNDEDALMKGIKMKIFDKELLMYDRVLRDIEDLMEEFQDPTENYWCKFYGYSLHELLLFQDLKASGYTVADRRKGLSLLDSSLALRTLGKFHAANMVLADRGIIKADMFSPYGPLACPNRCEIFFVKSIRNLCEVMEQEWGPEWRDVREKLKAPKEEIVSKILAINKKEGHFDTLLHGDFWVNNIMYRYDESGYPIGIKLIDFQVCFYGSAAFDISYFMYTSVNPQVRKKESENLLKIYYDSLCSSLKLYGYSPNDYPPYEDLLKQMKRHRIWALMALVYYHSFISAEGSGSMDILALIQSKGEKGHNKDVFRSVQWRESIGEDLRTLVNELFP